MKKYNPLNGVPRLSYYLTEIIQFADLEIPQRERVLYTSRSKQELIALCKENGWACPDAENSEGWYTHYIEYRGIL